METTITALQQEIERLNIIISALVQQNMQLKHEILLLKQTADGDEIIEIIPPQKIRIAQTLLFIPL